ncbi:hypothetical protein B0H17DRAFT_423099 [Mycena rosella]|uniref:Uncharacterized protein n=1 Tax=Mycena rosella TaxID=1033263 RepID=A0AAD7DNN1_MYCRO|nr:hypothetical protein B0H17DRAFT_423099 [Mycena rosella]
MPDLSKNSRGFAAGTSTTNAACYLAVFEEYASGEGSFGYRISFTANKIVYNATSRLLMSPPETNGMDTLQVPL